MVRSLELRICLILFPGLEDLDHALHSSLWNEILSILVEKIHALSSLRIALAPRHLSLEAEDMLLKGLGRLQGLIDLVLKIKPDSSGSFLASRTSCLELS